MAFGFPRPASRSVSAATFFESVGGAVELQSSNVSANNVALTVQQVQAGLITCATGMNAGARTTLTLPTVASLIVAGYAIGDRIPLFIVNANTAYGVTVYAGTGLTASGFTVKGFPYIQASTGSAFVELVILTATTGLAIVEVTGKSYRAGILTADTTLTVEDSGQTFGIDTTAGTVAITLPSDAANLSFQFVLLVAAFNATIVFPAAPQALLYVGTGAASVYSLDALGTTLTFVQANGSAPGDYVNCYARSATEYTVFGVSTATAAAALTLA